MMRKVLMLITDVGMISYWAITALVALNILTIPVEWLFRDYYDARVIAWNWSFFPLDMLLSITGLLSLEMERRGLPNWRIMATMSLCFTVCAGLMAISYWIILGEFDLEWWGPNLFLMLWPIPYLLSWSFKRDV